MFGRKTVLHPAPVVDRPRVEPIHQRATFPVGSLTDAPTTRRELAPRNVDTSMFDFIGKRPAQIIRPVTSLAFAEWQGVAQWPFSMNRPLIPLRVPIGPHQAMNPFSPRVNVDMPPQTTLGAQVALKVVPYVDPITQGKLGVMS